MAKAEFDTLPAFYDLKPILSNRTHALHSPLYIRSVINLSRSACVAIIANII